MDAWVGGGVMVEGGPGAQSLSLCPPSVCAGLRAAKPWADPGHTAIRSLKYPFLPKPPFLRLKASSANGNPADSWGWPSPNHRHHQNHLPQSQGSAGGTARSCLRTGLSHLPHAGPQHPLAPFCPAVTGTPAAPCHPPADWELLLLSAGHGSWAWAPSGWVVAFGAPAASQDCGHLAPALGSAGPASRRASFTGGPVGGTHCSPTLIAHLPRADPCSSRWGCNACGSTCTGNPGPVLQTLGELPKPRLRCHDTTRGLPPFPHFSILLHPPLHPFLSLHSHAGWAPACPCQPLLAPPAAGTVPARGPRRRNPPGPSRGGTRRSSTRCWSWRRAWWAGGEELPPAARKKRPGHGCGPPASLPPALRAGAQMAQQKPVLGIIDRDEGAATNLLPSRHVRCLFGDNPPRVHRVHPQLFTPVPPTPPFSIPTFLGLPRLSRARRAGPCAQSAGCAPPDRHVTGFAPRFLQ